MKKIINIEGMSCNHCVMAVKKSLEMIKEVKSADVSLEEQRATVELSTDVDDNILKQAVIKAGYSVKNIY